MTPSPPKPWENQAGVSGSIPHSTSTNFSSAAASSTMAPAADNTITNSSFTTTTAPPIPSRSYDTSDPLLNAVNGASSLYPSRFGTNYGGMSSYGGLSSYSSPYSRLGGYGNSMYGGYGGYGGMGSSMYGGMGSSMYGGMGGSMYGGYGGYNGFGGMGDPNDPNSLSRRMEAGTQATFQIIESIVGAFGGFAQMLESTFMATHSSFFAMISVAEQFGNLRDTLGSLFGIYALMRYFRVTMAKLRGQPIPPEQPDITTDSFNQFDPSGPPPPPSLNKKPLVIFLLAVFGLPYLMGKLIRAMARSAPQRITSRPLDLGSAQFYRAVFDFTPRNGAQELALRKGDIVAVVVQGQGGWWRARARDGREGFVPSNYLERVYNPAQQVGEGRPIPILSPPGEKGHAFIEEFKDED